MPTPNSSSAAATNTSAPAGFQPSRASDASATPHLPGDELATERVALPLGRVREDDIGVRKERQSRPVAAAKTRDEIRARGILGVEITCDAVRLEVVAQELGRRGLVARWIRRVDPDEALQQVYDFVAHRHLRLPTMTVERNG
jgi:hypothetical protein